MYNNNNNNTARHSGDCLFALPIASCGLKLDDEAVRVAVGLRLGLDLCVPHLCRCGSPVDARGQHSLVCKHAPGRLSRHHVLNDLVARAFAAAGVPVAKQPVGLVLQDGKRPDGVTLNPFEGGRSMTWDVTVVCTTAGSIDLAVQGPGCVAEMAASRKEAKYATLQTHYDFHPIAVETLSPINESATSSFLYDLGRRISLVSGEDREPQLLF